MKVSNLKMLPLKLKQPHDWNILNSKDFKDQKNTLILQVAGGRPTLKQTKVFPSMDRVRKVAQLHKFLVYLTLHKLIDYTTLVGI